MSQIVFVDLETTGLDPERHGLIEIGAIYHLPLGITVPFQRYANPGAVDIEEKALEVNGITRETFRRAPLLHRVLSEFDSGVEDGALLAGWNIPFDAGFLKKGYEKSNLRWRFDYHLLDVWSIFYTLREISHRQFRLNLRGLAVELGLTNPEDGKAHSALQDITWTYRLWKWAIEPELREVELYAPRA